MTDEACKYHIADLQEEERDLREELGNLEAVQRDFSWGMEDRWELKAMEGCRGWDKHSSKDIMMRKLFKNIARFVSGENDRAVDVAVLAMFLWNLGRYEDNGS
jgi:hypothetical protein